MHPRIAIRWRPAAPLPPPLLRTWTISCTDDDNRGRVALIGGLPDHFVANSFVEFVERSLTTSDQFAEERIPNFRRMPALRPEPVIHDLAAQGPVLARCCRHQAPPSVGFGDYPIDGVATGLGRELPVG